MAQATLRIVATLTAKPDKASELRELLRGLIAPTRQEPGCLAYELLENEADPAQFTFVEEWRDAKALDAHFSTDHIQGAIARFPALLDGEMDLRRCRLVG